MQEIKVVIHFSENILLGIGCKNNFKQMTVLSKLNSNFKMTSTLWEILEVHFMILIYLLNSVVNIM